MISFFWFRLSVLKHLVSVRSGNQYLLGVYDPNTETFVAEGHGCPCCPIPPTCLADQQHELDHGWNFEWAALQNTAGGRTMNNAWIRGVAVRGAHDDTLSGIGGANRNPPGSSLSLTREVTYDPVSRRLAANPMPELNALHNYVKLVPLYSIYLEDAFTR